MTSVREEQLTRLAVPELACLVCYDGVLGGRRRWKRCKSTIELFHRDDVEGAGTWYDGEHTREG